MDGNTSLNNITVLICNGNEPLPKQGGMERVTDALARGLLERGVKVVLLCKNPNRLGETYTPPCPLFFLPEYGRKIFIKKLLTNYKVTHVIDQGEGEIVGKFGYFRTREACFDNITLIAVQHNNARGVMDNYKRVMSGSFSNSALQWSYNNLFLPLRKWHSLGIIKKMHRELADNYDKIVMLSPEFIDDFLYYNCNADKNKLLSIPNMNTYKEVTVVPKQNRALFVGRLISSIKGCDKLLNIWKKATEGINGWQLDIVGDGPDRFRLEKQAEMLGLTSVVFHGFKNPEPFYQQSKIFCMTSIYEGFGMVLTEAMQHGVVPIAFESYKAVNDIIEDSVDGFLISPFDELQYVWKLRTLMSDNDLLASIGKQSALSVQKFSKDKIIDKWIRLLSEK